LFSLETGVDPTKREFDRQRRQLIPSSNWLTSS